MVLNIIPSQIFSSVLVSKPAIFELVLALFWMTETLISSG